MAAIISIAVGFAGAAVGSAIGAAIGGTILGISAATIGGVIGAGIAGGLLSMARGGEFGRGFLMGAGGAAVGAFASSFFGGAGAAGDMAEGATQAADGTTTAAMLEGQGGADFAPDALSGDMASGVTEAGAAGAGGEIAAGGIDPTMAQPSPMGTGDIAATSGQPLDQTVSQAAQGSSYNVGDGNLFGNAAETTAQGLEQTVSGANAPSSYMESAGAMAPESYSMDASGSNPSVPLEGSSEGGIGGMIKSSDAWLQENLGAPQGSTARLALGGMDALMKNYQTNKLEREANKMAPLTFEQFKQQHFDPNKYRIASNQMARSGHTGTLPALLARMNQGAQEAYSKYLPGAQEANYNRRQGIAAARTAGLSNLFNPYMNAVGRGAA